MPLQMNGTNIGGVYYGDRPISRVYLGSTLVWQSFDSSWQVVDLSKTITVPDGAAFMDIIALGGGGGGGGNSTPASGWAGDYAAAMWSVSAGKTATIVIGSAGKGGEGGTVGIPRSYGKAGGATTVAMSGQSTLSASGGLGVSNVTGTLPAGYGYRDKALTGEISGDFTYALGGTSVTVSGGTPSAAKNTAGPWPGGGGGGWSGTILGSGPGQAGASGCVWYRFRAS